jgi:small GTP-binding protein
MVLVGNAGVGKTSIVQRQLRDKSTIAPTVGMSARQLTEDCDGREIILDVTDTAGEERYRSLLPIYFRDAHIVVMVFDRSSRESFDALPEWNKFVRDICQVTRVLVANKCDLPSAVDVSEIDEMREDLGIETCFQTSAEDGMGIDALFMWIFDAVATVGLDRIDAVKEQDQQRANCGGCGG